MRRKNNGGRARLSKLHPQPSAMAFTYLCKATDFEAHPNSSHDDIGVNIEANNDGHCSTVAETCNDSDRNRQCHEVAANSTGEMVVPAEKPCSLDPQEVHQPEECLEMDWTETEVCIKCDKGGKLLVCSDGNCPLAVHEECMQCPARFDSLGNFYCPYCSYKRAMLETREARKKAMLAKKALSVFLDHEMMDGDSQRQKAEKHRRKEPKPSTALGDRKADHRNRPDADEVDHNVVQMEEDQHEETFDLCANASAVNEQNDVLSGCGHSARPDDVAQHKVVIQERTQAIPSIACGDNGTCCREEETRPQFDIVQDDKSVQAEHPKLVDDRYNERFRQEEQQPDRLGATLIEKETESDSAIHISTAGQLENAHVVKEHEGSRAEAEAMVDQEKGTTSSSSGDDWMQQQPVEDSDISHGDNGYVSPQWRGTKMKNQHTVRSPSVDSPRRSARKLSKPDANVVHKKKKNAIPKPRLTSPTIPHARRKKLPWTAEEEEMLKEGVQKFSTTVNKNLPWMKILEFGHHVFDGTRTPADLKDKWRNILVKECSKK